MSDNEDNDHQEPLTIQSIDAIFDELQTRSEKFRFIFFLLYNISPYGIDLQPFLSPKVLQQASYQVIFLRPCLIN